MLNTLLYKKMTVDTKAITVPSWVFSVVLPLMIGLLSYIVGLGTINAKTEVRLEHLHEEVIRLDAGKASDDKVEAVEATLESVQQTVIRIESKLDKHIASSAQ